jgi:hypothetical protein
MDNTKNFDILAAALARLGPNPPATPVSGYLNSLLGAVQTPAPAPAPVEIGGIRFGRNNGETVRFSEPVRFRRSPFYGESLSPLPGAGLYAVLVADGSASPRPFRVLYFGESENIDRRASSSHERYGDWCATAGGGEKLFVAYCWMIGSSKDERTSVESGLIGHYRPRCNTVFNHPASPF